MLIILNFNKKKMVKLNNNVTWLITWYFSQVFFIKPIQCVGADCKCILYQDTFGKEYGVFTSPNWPVPYEDNINCLLYHFMSKMDEIIEITFDEFDLQKTNLACIYGDYVKLYLHLNDSGVNEKSYWNKVLCGKIADIEQTHYSSSQSLIFQFHSDWRTGNHTGFRGTFRFLKKQLFEIDGELISNSQCDYKFESSKLINKSKMNSSNHKGRFYSPYYPSTYPKGIKCSYTFIGEPMERIKLVFEKIQLQKSDSSCLNNPDVIYIYDGPSKLSPLIGQLCNINTFVELVSSGPELYINFLAKSHFPGQGFKAKFYFEKNFSNINFNSPFIESKSTVQIQNSSKFIADCDYYFNSDVLKSGNFSSPNYPNPYPINAHCEYHFTGRGKERVQIKFNDFSIYKPQENLRDCEGADRVMLFITINGQKESVDNFCGNNLPQQIMSNGPSMTVEFQSLYNLDQSKGFHATYSFITNFGITSGTQDNQSVCGFIFKSWESSNGTFTSPNYPGFYPRDTECHYFFFGNESQKVHITFAYFDVEGIVPCNPESQSDFVEFSNYRTVDRKIPRHCGNKKPEAIESDGSFFRITFKSNDRFDGTGFQAFYQFRGLEDTFQIKQVRGLSSSSTQNLNRLSILINALIVIINSQLTQWFLEKKKLFRK